MEKSPGRAGTVPAFGCKPSPGVRSVAFQLSRRVTLSDLCSNFERLEAVHFRVNLGRVAPAVSENELCGLDAELSADLRGGIVAESMRGPGGNLGGFATMLNGPPVGVGRVMVSDSPVGFRGLGRLVAVYLAFGVTFGFRLFR